MIDWNKRIELELRAVLAVAIAAMTAAFAVHVTARLSEILTILEGMK